MLLKTLIGTIAIASIACSVYAREVDRTLSTDKGTYHHSRDEENGLVTTETNIHGNKVELDSNVTKDMH